MNIKQILNIAQQKLSKHSQTPALDAEVLLSFAIKKPREFLYSHPEIFLNKSQLNKFNKLIARRKKQEPIAYITNNKNFYDLDFYVDRNVLIPRPDTELIIDEVLKLKKNINNILDIGTGSGCIAVTLKIYLLNSQVVATDISRAAIKIARKNANKHCVDIKFYVSDLFKKLPKKYKNKFDVIVFNPPYLTKNEANKKSLKYEPSVALTPKNFKKIITEFLKQSQKYTNKNSYIFIEIGNRQVDMVKKIAKQIFPNSQINIIKDLGGFDRVVKIDTCK